MRESSGTGVDRDVQRLAHAHKKNVNKEIKGKVRDSAEVHKS